MANDAYTVAAGGNLYAGVGAPPPPPPPPSVGLAGPATVTVGVESSNFTATAANITGANVGTTIDSASSTRTPNTLNFAPGELVRLFTLTALAAGEHRIKVQLATGQESNEVVVTASPAPTPAPPPPTPGTTLATLTLSAPADGTVPFAVGHAFAQGHMPAANQIVCTGASVVAQATVKTTWPDGSAKFAILAGTATIASGTAALAISAGTQAAGTALTTADLIATGITASIGAGAFGSAAFGNTEWAAPFQTWVSGPRMSSWLYRKQVGSDAHLVAWLEVRLFAGGAVEVLPWIENGYLTVAGPTAKSETYTFTLGGTQRFSAAINLLNHQRTPLVSGTALSHWLGSDPGVSARHDVAYLQATEMVPSYHGTVSPSASAVTGLPSTFTPLQQGSYPTTMGSAGYHGSIGLLPEWDVLYLTSTASSTWAAIQRNAYSAGRYGIHFRDQATNRPLRFSQYPNLVLEGSSGVVGTGASTTNSYTPAATGGTPPTYNSTHCPALGYMAHLLTGRFYHLETAQFQATLHFLKNTDSSGSRNFSQGILRTDAGANTTRGAAWSLRSLAQALAITPDGDVLQTELKNSFEANVTRYHARYVAQSHNTQGWVTPYTDYTSGDGIFFAATWQQDFFTAAIGLAKSLGLPLATGPKAQLDAFFAWKAQSVVGRLGGFGASEYPWPDAAPYTIPVSPSETPNFDNGTGPWYATWGALYDASTGSPNRSGTALRDGGIPDGTSYWGNMLPALAYAVRHGVTGASAGLARIAGATNWSALLSSFNTAPVWGVRPHSDPSPVSVLAGLAASMSAGQWQRLTSLTGLSTSLFIDGANNTLDYMDKGGYDPINRQIRFIGQAHIGDQRLHQYDEATNAFSNLADPPWDTGGSGYPGYLGHGYQHNTIDPATGDMYYRQTGDSTVRRLNRATGTWSTIAAAQTSGNAISGALEWLPEIGTQGGLISLYGEYVQRWDKATNTWSTVSSSLAGAENHRFAVRSQPNGLVLLGGGNGGSTAMWSIGATGGLTSRAACPIGMGVTIGVTVCCPVSGDLIVIGTSSARRYSVASNTWSTLTFSGAPSWGSINSGTKLIAIPLPAYGVIAFVLGGAAQLWLYKHA